MDKQFVCEECNNVFYQGSEEEDFETCPYCGASSDKFIENISVDELEDEIESEETNEDETEILDEE